MLPAYIAIGLNFLAVALIIFTMIAVGYSWFIVAIISSVFSGAALAMSYLFIFLGCAK